MILVTVGTSTEPFDRLIRAVDLLPAEEDVIVQRGASRVEPGHRSCVEFFSFDELVVLIRRARVVVTHAGVGSVLTSLMNGKKPVVLPRVHRLGEAVDDHQVAFALRLHRAGLVAAVGNERDLTAAVLNPAIADRVLSFGDGPLTRALRIELSELLGRALTPTPEL